MGVCGRPRTHIGFFTYGERLAAAAAAASCARRAGWYCAVSKSVAGGSGSSHREHRHETDARGEGWGEGGARPRRVSGHFFLAAFPPLSSST